MRTGARSRVPWRVVMAPALFCWINAALVPAPSREAASEDRADELAAAPAGQPPGKPTEQPPLAALVKIPLPITSGAEVGLKLSLTRARDQLIAAAREKLDGRRPLLVLEISSAENAAEGGAGSQFESVLTLARFLSGRDMADVKTVAWLPRSIRGHGVLVALGCEEIVMAADAEIGEAGVDEPEQGAASQTVVAAYREIADAKRTVPVAIAVGMIDPAAEVIQVESDAGLRFLLRSEVEDFRRDHEVVKEQVLVAAGTLGRFTGREGRQFGFVKYLAADKAAVAQALGVSAESLEEDRSLLANWQPIMLDVHGEITPALASQLKTLLFEHVHGGANWVGVRIESDGGDLPACIDLAQTLAGLDRKSVRTVAYVPVEARGGAALIALSCDELVMHPEATVGVGPEAQVDRPPRDNRGMPPMQGPGRNWRRRGPVPRDEDVDVAAAVASIRDVAPQTDRSWSLLAAMIDPGVEVFQYRNKVSGRERLMSAEETASLPDAANWARGAPLQAGNDPLALNGRQAAQLGVAGPTVDNFDQLKQRFGLKEDPLPVEPTWALKLVDALRSPALATFLLFLGFIGAYVEIKTPGVGVGGVVSAIAFILFFWSKYLDQTAGSLEIVMFLSGMILILLEIFVIPGFGIFGLAGGLLVIFSLILAGETAVIPKTPAQMEQLRSSITTVAAAGIGMIALAFATRRYLPRSPLFSRMVLEPPPPEERVTLSSREALANYSHLVGVQGEAATDLRPAGKASIDDQLIDVIAEGEPLDRGTRVVVVAAHAHRVLVRAV